MLLIACSMSLPAQIVREQADSIVLKHLQNELTQPYTLYVYDNAPSKETIPITTTHDETFKAKYACWVYYLKENEPFQCRYLFVKEDDGNLLEIIAHNDEGQNDLTQWKLVEPVGIVGAYGIRPSIQVYPNPTTGQLTIENGQLTINNVGIFDMMGRKQLSIVNCQLSIEINISHLPAGIYFVQIQTEKEIVTKKVIKH